MYNKSIKNNSYIRNLIFMFIISIFICFNSLVPDHSEKIIFNIILIFIVQILIFFLFKLDIISSICFFAVWILIPSIIVYYTGSGNYGNLSLNFVPIYLYEDTIYVFIFIIVFSFSAYLLKINLYEERILKHSLPNFNHVTIVINNLIAIAFSFISFPTFPTFGEITVSSNRFQMLLPGHAWNQLAIVALLFNLPYFFKKKSVVLTYVLVIGWFLMHGERADVSGLLLGILIIILFSKKISLLKKITYLIISVLFASLLISIGFARINGYFPNMIDSINSFATFSTVADISYLLNVSVDYIQSIGFTHGQILFKTILSAIPFVNGSNVLGGYINSFYPNPGGSSLISNQIMDGGIPGIIFITLIYSFLVKMIVNKNSTLFKYEFLILICSIPRISWYGINYVFTSMIFFVPFMYILNEFLNYKK